MECVECGVCFDPRSKEKKAAGGRINTCPLCSEEPAPKVLGFASGDGKQASLSILRFASQADAKAYKDYFYRASGMDKGKSCQMHRPGLTAPGVHFSIVSVEESRNHKGKA